MTGMLRALFFFAVLGLAVWGAVSLADQPGRVSLEWGGVRVDTSFAFLLGVVAFIAFVAALAAYVLPSKFTVSLLVITTDRLYVPLVWAMRYTPVLRGRPRFRLIGVTGTAGTCSWVAASACVASALARSLIP